MSNRVYVRIDNRLLHGQVVQFWIPHLSVEKLLVADDEVFGSEAMQTIYRMALPEHVQLAVMPTAELAEKFSALGEESSLVLIRTIDDAKSALDGGCPFERIMIGNVHASPERTRVTDAVYLSEHETNVLCDMRRRGVEIEIQTFPGEVLRLTLTEGGSTWLRC